VLPNPLKVDDRLIRELKVLQTLFLSGSVQFTIQHRSSPCFITCTAGASGLEFTLFFKFVI
jgi:hypothetical protein